MIGLALFAVIENEIAGTGSADDNLLKILVRVVSANDIRLRTPDVIDTLDLERKIRALLKRDERPVYLNCVQF